jgi:hypothetical protein
MMSRLRALLDPRLALLLVPVVAVGVFLVVSGSGTEATATHSVTTTTFETEPASSHSDFKVPPRIPADAPPVTAADYGDTNPLDRAVRNRAATIRAARAQMGDPIDTGDSPASVDALVQTTTTTIDAGVLTSTTVAAGIDPTTTVATPTTLVDNGPQPVVSESGSPLVLLLVAVGVAVVALGAVGWWRRVRVRRAA